MKKLLKIIVCAVFTLLTVIVNTQAATFNVENLNDSGEGSLRQAIADANSSEGADTINISLTGTILLQASLPAITDSVTINGGSQTAFIIDGQGVSGVRPLYVNAAGIVVNINNLTVTGGNGTSLGGGVRVDSGAILNLMKVTIAGNTATGAGGIYIAGASSVNIFNSLVTNNAITAAGGDGGGIVVSSSTLFMTGTTVSGNSVPSTPGSGSTGGGITGVLSSTPGAPASLIRLENSTFSGNTAEQGGGVYASGGSNLRMSNVTVTGNTSGVNGGGVYLNAGSAIIRNSTIAGNAAQGTGAGGGIYTTGAGAFIIANSIFADNTAGNANSQEIRATTTSGGTFSSRGTNIIEGPSSGAITVQSGSNLTGVDPQLAGLADNGGFVQTRAIAESSNARNAGDNSEALDTADAPVPIATDARGIGFARISENTVDVGAFEFGSAAPASRTKFDFDGDGSADISLFRPSNGFWYRLNSSNDSFASFQFGLSTDKLVPADYDGDGKTDLAVYRDGSWYISQSSNNAFRALSFGTAEDLPHPADFDGDGRADISVFRPSTGIWYRLNSSNDEFAAVRFGQAGDVPVSGDYDGDGRADVTVYRPSNNVWYRINSSDAQFQFAYFGFDGDIPLSGDFNGDGKDDLAVFRPGNSFWYVAHPNGVPAQNFDSVHFGLSPDIPVPADYDGDGRTDIAVYRPSDGTWYRLNSENNQLSVNAFGTATDKPIPSAYQP